MKRQLDWIEISVLTGGISILIAIIYPMVQSAREAAARDLYKERLHQIGVALHAYHDRYDCFPPAHVRDPDGKRWHS